MQRAGIYPGRVRRSGSMGQPGMLLWGETTAGHYGKGRRGPKARTMPGGHTNPERLDLAVEEKGKAGGWE